MLLAIDTATRWASLALYNSEGVQAETTWRARENHTVELMAQVARLLELGHTTKENLSAVGVALGPGSHTGLRVGLSVAKGLAYARQIPLLGIPTLDVVACVHAHQPLPIWAVLAAGRGRYSVAEYAARRGTVKRVSDYALVDAAGLLDLVARAKEESAKMPRALFCGDVDAALARALAKECGSRAVVASPALSARRAGLLAELAWARYQRAETDDPKSLVPTYVSYPT